MEKFIPPNRGPLTVYTRENAKKLATMPEVVLQMHFMLAMSCDEEVRELAVNSLDLLLESKCQSPIEQAFLYAFQIITSWTLLDYAIWLEEQVKINASNGKTYRVDFLFDSKTVDPTSCSGDELVIGKPLKLIIECDGHDFHEVTKAQVAYRNERDYALKSDGYDIIRFSGSQIYRDPFECASDAIAYILKKTGGFYIKDGDLQKHPDVVLD